MLFQGVGAVAQAIVTTPCIALKVEAEEKQTMREAQIKKNLLTRSNGALAV